MATRKRRAPSARRKKPLPTPPCPACGSVGVIPVNTSPRFMTAWYSCAVCYHVWSVLKQK